MRNIKWCVGLLIVVLLITMSGCSMLQKEKEGISYSFTEEGDFKVLELEEVVLKIDNGSLSEEAMNETASLVEKASEAADRFLGEYKKEEAIVCYVHGGDIQH